MDKTTETEILLYQIFEKQVVDQPNDLALKLVGIYLTYQELSLHSDLIAYQLFIIRYLTKSIGSSCHGRNWKQIVAVLEVLKSVACSFTHQPCGIIRTVKPK